MACQETDYLREFEFLDFPVEEKLLHPSQQQFPVYNYKPHAQVQTQTPALNNYPLPQEKVENVQPGNFPRPQYFPNPQPTNNHSRSFFPVASSTRLPQNANLNIYNYEQNIPFLTPSNDLLTNLNLDIEEKDLFQGFDALLNDQHQGRRASALIGLEALKKQPEINSSSDTIAIFESHSPRGKRTRDIKVEKPIDASTKKRKLATSVPLPSVDNSAALKFKTKQKRTKWLRKEVENLWEGIAMYGNNWRLIKKKAFAHRTYYQVKDKGRRILSTQGWSSGRTKATHDGAAEEAKMIAEKVLLLSRATAAESPLKRETHVESSFGDVTSNVGSAASPTASADRDTELDFDLDFDCH